MSSSAISEAQLAANRENAQHSTGPKSEQGKARVRLNGLNHGLTGDTILMPYEDAVAYEAFVAGIVSSLNPESAPEQTLARSIADGHWRRNRARAIESNIFALGLVANPDSHQALTEAQTYLDNARQFQLLTLYEGRIDRAIRRDAAELKELQTARLAAHQKSLEEAALLAQVRNSKGQPYDPASDGFGFSRDFLDRHIDRQKRLAEARRLVPAPESGSKPPFRRAA